ncbi:MAG: glucose-1-phosphate adenylyltransferase, partial [Lysobacterales bacterium]
GIYVFDAAFLARTVAIDAARPESGHDFAADVLPRLIDSGRVFAHAFRAENGSARAYWRDIGTLRAYWQAHMDLLGPAPLLRLDDPRWPIGRVALAPQILSPSTTTADGGTIEDSLISTRCTIAGHVLRSVLSDAVEVEPGADVTESVVLPGAVIGANSRLRGVIVDTGYRVAEGIVIEQCAETGELPVLSTHHGDATVCAPTH